MVGTLVQTVGRWVKTRPGLALLTLLASVASWCWLCKYFAFAIPVIVGVVVCQKAVPASEDRPEAMTAQDTAEDHW